MAESAPELTPQEQRFVEEFCKDRNQVRAALEAKLSTSYSAASNAAHRMLENPRIREAIKYVLRVQAKRLNMTVPDVVREWAILGKSDLDDYTVDGDGRVTVRPGVPRSALRAVKKVKQTRTEKLTGRGDRQELTVEIKTEIELHGKETSLSKLHEHFHGVLPGEVKQAGGIPIEYAIEFAEYLAAKRKGLPGVVPPSLPVVPDPGTAEPSLPLPGG
jgi:phage terminase small subunit